MVIIVVFAHIWLICQVAVSATQNGTTPAPSTPVALSDSTKVPPTKHEPNVSQENPLTQKNEEQRTTNNVSKIQPTNQEKLSSNTTQSTLNTLTHKAHQQPKKLTKQQADERHRTCHGWCFRDIWNTVTKPPKSTSAAQNSAQDRRLSELHSAVNNVPYFPITAKFNLFADSHQYKDHTRRLLRSKLLDKNVMRIPGDVFYPYTRRALHGLLINSGIAHDPLLVRSAPAVRLRNKTKPSDYDVMANEYWKTNPLLYNILPTAERKANFAKPQANSEEKDYQGEDDYNEDQKQEENEKEDANGGLFNRRDEKESNIKARALDLDDFVFGNNKQRSKLRNSSPLELLGVYGPHQEETMLVDPPDNAVDDVVAGMKVKSKDSRTFVIGSTKHARSNIINWMGPNDKSRSKLLSDKTGLVVEGENKKRAIDVLLKSMTNNYQYKPKTADVRHQKRCFGFGFSFGYKWGWGCGCGFCSYGCCC